MPGDVKNLFSTMYNGTSVLIALMNIPVVNCLVVHRTNSNTLSAAADDSRSRRIFLVASA